MISQAGWSKGYFEDWASNIGMFSGGLYFGHLYDSNPKHRTKNFPFQDFDDAIRFSFYGKSPKEEYSPTQKAFATLSDFGLLSLLAPYGTSLLRNELTEAEGVQLLRTLTLTYLLTNSLKFTIRRPRPKLHSFPNSEAARDDIASFPSGHGSLSFSLAYLSQKMPHIRQQWPTWAAYLIASSVSVLRVAGEKHFASDVIFGAGLGYLSGYLSWNVLGVNQELQVRGNEKLVMLNYRVVF